LSEKTEPRKTESISGQNRSKSSDQRASVDIEIVSISEDDIQHGQQGFTFTHEQLQKYKERAMRFKKQSQTLAQKLGSRDLQLNSAKKSIDYLSEQLLKL
jgi:hypothetical protein